MKDTIQIHSVQIHSVKDVDDFIKHGGRITKLVINVDNAQQGKDPLDMTLRDFVIMTAESNAAVSSVSVTLEDATEADIIIVVGITTEVVKTIRDFADNLMQVSEQKSVDTNT